MHRGSALVAGECGELPVGGGGKFTAGKPGDEAGELDMLVPDFYR